MRAGVNGAHLRFMAQVYHPNPPRHRRGLQKAAIRPVGHRAEVAGSSETSRLRSVNEPQMRPGSMVFGVGDGGGAAGIHDAVLAPTARVVVVESEDPESQATKRPAASRSVRQADRRRGSGCRARGLMISPLSFPHRKAFGKNADIRKPPPSSRRRP